MKNLKKFLSIVLVVLMAFFTACSNKVESENNNSLEKTNLYVFAAASMTETLTKIANEYQKENNNINILFNFDSSK